MKNIKIAVLDSPDGNRQAAFAQAGLASQGIASELVVLGGLSAQEGERAIQEALLRGDADMAVQALADLPTQAAEGLVVAPGAADPAEAAAGAAAWLSRGVSAAVSVVRLTTKRRRATGSTAR